MPMLPTAVEMGALCLLSLLWLMIHRQVKNLDGSLVYHLASYHRDRYKARFYFYSVWVGLITTFLSFRCLEVLATVSFETSVTKFWILGILRGLGLWGLLLIAAVWSQVGYRVSLPNSDGRSLIPLPDTHKP